MISSEQYTKYPQGSIWRKWDLHVHTKGTMKNDKFDSQSLEEFCLIMFRKALENDIAVIGITDYFSLENYKEVKNIQSKIISNEIGSDFNSNDLDKISKILLLPNMEMRLTVRAEKTFINIHFIFNPDFINDNFENNFLNKFKYDGFFLNKQGLIALGKKINPLLNDQEAYKKGIETYVVEVSSIQETMEDQCLRDNMIVMIAEKSTDGNSGLRDSFPHIREMNLNLVDALFTSREKDINYYLGKGIDTPQKIIDRCGKLLPCFHGSDAHTEKDIFKPDHNRFCWIKADPTFEGLKQVIHEPENRVKIQELSPNIKANYDVIDRIEIQNNEVIGNKTIFLNPDLNVIIGGRSSGKSALLAGLAYHLGCGAYIRDDKYQKYIIDDFSKGFSVFFKGEEEPYSNDGEQKKIEYYAQNKFSELSKEQSDFNEIIAKIVSKDSEYHKILAYNSQRKTLEKELRQVLEQCWVLNSEIEKINDNIKDMPLAHELSNQVLILDDEYKSLGSDQLSDDDRIFYEQLSKNKTDQKDKLLRIQSYSDLSIQLKQEPMIDISPLRDVIDKTYFHNIETKEFLTQELECLESGFKKGWLEHLQKFEDSRIQEEAKVQEEIDNLNRNTRYKSILEKIQINSESDRILKQLTSIRSQESKLIKLHNEVNLKRKEVELKQKVVIRLFLQFFQQLESLVDDFVIVPQSLNNQESLKITLNISNKYDEYIKIFITEKCDLRKLHAKIDLDISSDYSMSKVHKKLYEFIQLIIQEPDILKGANNIETVIEDILTRSWFEFNYDVEYEEDAFSEMSEGKKSFVMLKLILEFSDKKVPLLIDQPEDDLDNRAIFSELVQYLRMKKYDRQIILVTHNANVVINADSEMVIIANQHGTNSPNSTNVKFEYVQGSIEHSFPKNNSKPILYAQGVKEHICEIMEGGTEAFKNREKRYNI